MNRIKDSTPYKMLAVAVVRQAIYDWRHMCRCEHGRSRNDKREHQLLHTDDVATFAEMKEFFQSSWCEQLCCGVSAETILDVLTNERNTGLRRVGAGSGSVRKPKTFGRKYTFNGETKTLTEWSEITGIQRNTLNSRLYTRGWSVERAFTTQIKEQK